MLARHATIEAATARAKATMGNAGRTGPGPRYLFSGLLECANCGAPFVAVTRDRYGCSAARYRGAAVCDVRTTVTRQRLETRLLDAIRGDLYSPQALATYRKAFVAELKRLAAQASPDVDALKRRLADLDVRIGNMVGVIGAGTHSPALLAALEQAEAERSGISGQIAASDPSAMMITLPRDLDALFKAQIAALETELARDVDAARECLRDMLGPVRIARRDNALVAELSGLYQCARYANFGSGGMIPLLEVSAAVILL